ncbi:hypothetical protein [Haloarchaeobius sp. TZWWS8]|uniref:hypothetical protein n=1 Tax=Haloarchaeobius sp. TZWWS8 TaxID=3446121 RepID=UPI003EC09B3F
MVRYASGREHGAAVLRRAGYEVRADDGPPVGSASGETTGLCRMDGPVVAQALAPGMVTAETIVPLLANGVEDGRATLFVVPTETDVGSALHVLDRPYCVAREDGDRCRTFFNGPDRVQLDDGRYALGRASEYVWREVQPGEAELEGRTGSDRKEVELVGDGEALALFADVDALSCPSASAFPYSYGRDADKQFHVRRRDGTEVGRFSGVRAMRENGFTPIPMPLVPEQVFRSGSLAGSWAVVAEDSFTVHTVDGQTSL